MLVDEIRSCTTNADHFVDFRHAKDQPFRIGWLLPGFLVLRHRDLLLCLPPEGYLQQCPVCGSGLPRSSVVAASYEYRFKGGGHSGGLGNSETLIFERPGSFAGNEGTHLYTYWTQCRLITPVSRPSVRIYTVSTLRRSVLFFIASSDSTRHA